MPDAADRPHIRLSLGLQSHAGLHRDGGRRLIAFAALAESVGLDGVLIGDHVVIGERLDRYPYPPVHFSQDADWLEPLTVLAAVAAVTTRITLSTGVLVAPLRPAVLLAKTAASLDAISGGRLELGLGVGWQPEEFSAVGVEFDRRGELLTDGVRACRALWQASPASYNGTTVAFEPLWCHPQPERPSGIPILFSGSLHERNLARIVELGVGWITHPGLPLSEVADGVALLRERMEGAGRDPQELRVRTRLPVEFGSDGRLDRSSMKSTVERYSEAGVTDLTVWSNSLTTSPDLVVSRMVDIGEIWSDLRPPV